MVHALARGPTLANSVGASELIWSWRGVGQLGARWCVHWVWTALAGSWELGIQG